MSRSIHTTRRDLARLKQCDFANTERRREALRRLRGDLASKRAVKEYVLAERRGQIGAPLPTSPESIPLQVLDEGSYIHYPADAADLLGVMRRLPAGVIDGLSGIELCLGIEYQRDEANGYSPDPYTGRIGYEVLPGVYMGHTRGVYFTQKALIHLFAYVYAPDIPDRAIWEAYLRLRMLSTFVHEVAHHYDVMARVARGRWRADQSDVVEIYAENMQHSWVRESVVPYLEATYPTETKALSDWVHHHGGIRLALADLAGESRVTCRGGYIRGSALFNMSGSLEELVRQVQKGESLKSTRLEFANQMHYQERYDDALKIIEQVLTEHPGDRDGLILKADIFVHQERYADAVDLAEQALLKNADSQEALRVLSDGYSELRQWEKAVEVNTRILALTVPGTWQWANALRDRGIALAASGDLEGARADLALLIGCAKRFVPSKVRLLTEAIAEFSMA